MKLNKVFISYILLLSIIGLLILYSATLSVSSAYFIKQSFWTLLGIIVMLLLSFIKPKVYYNLSVPFYVLSLLLLLFVLLFSYAGVHRWINLGFIRLQPSEIAKLALILMLAKYVQGRKFAIYSHKVAFNMFFLSIIPMGLVLIEPDLGTSTVFMALLIGIMLLIGMDMFLILFLILPVFSIILSFHRILWFSFLFFVGFIWVKFRKDKREIIFFLLLIIISGIISPIAWGQLKEYQKNRIISFINPSKDPLGYGWHLLQSEIAIGSGGVTGKGFANGTQKGLNFIPQHHTDFIFSTAGEEFGFIGSIIIISLIFSFIIYLLYKSYQAKSRFSTTVIAGYAVLLFYQAAVNIGMVLGFLPVVGLPLPFFSYGGSSAMLFFVLSGIVLSLISHKYENI